MANADVSRRRCLLSVLALCSAANLSEVRAQTVIDATRLGKAWRLPPDAHLELRAARHGMDLSRALAAVQEWTIPSGSRLVIRVDDGEYLLAQTIVWQHPDGARLAVVGNTRDPGRCRLVWSGGGDGIYVGAGGVLGNLDGFTLAQATAGGQGSGMLADEGGAIVCGQSVRIESFYYGVQARRNGTVRCEGAQCSGGGDANFFAFMGGHVYARRALAVGARDDARRLGSGFVAEYGGSIDAEGAVARHNALDGFTALSNGAIRAYRSRSERNGRSGYHADTGGRIVGHDAVAEANCGDGVVAADGARSITGEHLVTAGNNAPADSCRRR